MKITVREVAAEAGVSVGTVSRVIRNKPSVSPDIAERVKKAVASLNYHPLRVRRDRVSSGGSSLQGRNIAIVMLAMDRSLETLPSIAAAIHGAESAVTAAGGTMMIIDCPDVSVLPKALAHEEIDGLLLKGALQGRWIDRISAPLLQRLKAIPSVWIMGRPYDAWGDSVTSNDYEVGRLAADALADAGHRHVATLNPKADHLLFARRESSFHYRAQQRGLTVARFDANLAPTPAQADQPLKPVHDVKCIDGLVGQLLDARPRPTAVFTPGDSIARLVYRALAIRSLRIGHDLALVSCNHEQSLNEVLFPSLATIDIQAAMAGRRAVDQLRWRLAHTRNGPKPHPAVEIALDPAWVPGDSLAPPPPAHPLPA